MDLCRAALPGSRMPLANSTRELITMSASRVHATVISAPDVVPTSMACALATFPSRVLYGFGALLRIAHESQSDNVSNIPRLMIDVRNALKQIVARQRLSQGLKSIIRILLGGVGISSNAYKKAVQTVATAAFDRLKSEAQSKA